MVQMHLPDDLAEEMEKLCELNHITKSEFFTLALQATLDSAEKRLAESGIPSAHAPNPGFLYDNSSLDDSLPEAAEDSDELS